jgi:hypothetical protein
MIYNMIVHVLTGSRVYGVPGIIKSFIKYKNNEDQFFMIVSEKGLDIDLYNDLFAQLNNSNYQLIDSFKNLKQEGSRFKNKKIILHGVPYKWMAYFVFNGFKDVRWVCWGHGASINKYNWKSILFTPLKKIIYQRLTKIAVLMPHDAESLRKDYKVTNITQLSYFGTIDQFPFTEEHIKCTNNPLDIKRIYLGNNSSSIRTYLPLTKKLSKFKDYVTINCMLNYAFNESQVSQQLESEGKRIYGDRFKMDTELYPLDEYYKYMDKCDIYICDVKKQTGLGAIYTCLRLGKKLFLSGINYHWMKSLGCIVFHTDEIDKMENEVFLQELSYEEKLNNYNIINSHLSLNRILNEWDVFLN